MQGKDFKERDCMSFDGFCISVRIDIQRRLGDSFLVYLNDVTKNNDTKLKALVITELLEHFFHIQETAPHQFRGVPESCGMQFILCYFP